MCPATSAGPPSVGVGWRAWPTTCWASSTMMASILVPPRSMPPRSRPFASEPSMVPGAYYPARLAPGLPVVLLLGRRLVDLHAQRGELQAPDLAVDGCAHR